MALSLRFPEEADFSASTCLRVRSRVVGLDALDESERPVSHAIFRWNKRVRAHLESKHGDSAIAGSPVVQVEKLIIGMPGGPERFVRELTTDWQSVGTLVVSDDVMTKCTYMCGIYGSGVCIYQQQPCTLASESISACVIVSKYDLEDENAAEKNVLAVRLPVAIAPESTWVWVNALQQHIHAHEVFCLDAQMSSTMYDSPYPNEQFPLLRMLATSSVSGEKASPEYPVRTLEVPRFTSGIPAALLTLRACGADDLRDATRTFSTRFLPSDGIPAYNALLDNHLGKRREYLLGNRKSLTLLQQTGVISRVQANSDDPNQYVVYMTEKPIHRRKRLPPPSRLSPASSQPLLSDTPWRTTSDRLGVVRNSESTPQLRKCSDREEQRGGRGKDCVDEEGENDEEDEEYGDDRSTPMAFHSRHRASTKMTAPPGTSSLNNASETGYPTSTQSRGETNTDSKVSMMRNLGRSLSTTAITRGVKPLYGGIHVPSSRDSRRKGEQQPEEDSGDQTGPRKEEPSSLLTETPFRMRSKSVLAVPIRDPQKSHDANHHRNPTALVTQKKPLLKGTVEHLLESDASYMAQIRVMRDQLAGLEQDKQRLDVEVAQTRKRLRGVNAVHENDVAVAHCSSIMQHRLSKAEEEYMKLLTAQLHVKKDVDRVRREVPSLKKVKRKLEADIEDVWHMNAAIEDRICASKMIRNLVSAELVELEKKTDLAVEEQRLSLPPEEAVVVDVEQLMNAVQERNVNRRSTRGMSTSSFSSATTPLQLPSNLDPTFKPPLDFRTAFQVIRNSLGYETLSAFIQGFIDTEEQLLSKYKANLTLEEEVVALQKDAHKLMQEAAQRHASIRGSYQVCATLHDEMQSKIHDLLARIDSYSELREVRNNKHSRVRSIMQRCLEVLQAEKLLSGQESIGGPMLMSELPSPALLEALQKKMTEVAMRLKMKHSAGMIEGPKNCFHAGRDAGARRSNMFSTREVSKIVLGPREPGGSALAAILGTAQAPSVEAAMALTERNSMENNHMYVCVADASTSSSLSTKKSARVYEKTRSITFSDDVDTGILVQACITPLTIRVGGRAQAFRSSPADGARLFFYALADRQHPDDGMPKITQLRSASTPFRMEPFLMVFAFDESKSICLSIASGRRKSGDVRAQRAGGRWLVQGGSNVQPTNLKVYKHPPNTPFVSECTLDSNRFCYAARESTARQLALFSGCQASVIEGHSSSETRVAVALKEQGKTMAATNVDVTDEYKFQSSYLTEFSCLNPGSRVVYRRKQKSAQLALANVRRATPFVWRENKKWKRRGDQWSALEWCARSPGATSPPKYQSRGKCRLS
ncbi:hypothetical protein FI667_g13538, partial [Globisporangium splendens]